MSKKPSNNKPSNKDRDIAINTLFQHVQQLNAKVEHLAQVVGGYIEFRKDGKRYSNWVKRKQEEANKNAVQKNEQTDGKNMEPSTADQG